VHGLRELGYAEGKNLILERRSAEGRFERFGEILAELIARKPEVIVVAGVPELAQAAKRATSTVPIVMAAGYNPVETGIVASLARPGGNITGFTTHAGPEIEGKRLQMLKEAVPAATRIAFLGLKSVRESLDGASVRAAAQTLGVTLLHAEHTLTHYADAFALISRDRPHALFVARHGSNFNNRQLIADFAVGQRMPGIYPYREIVAAGGLMSYGTSNPDLFRRAAEYVDRILKGAKPADLPVQQPTRFELVINLETAKALGITIPPTLHVFADELIE
jgi:putative ABC transport system substrate-binding protein